MAIYYCRGCNRCLNLDDEFLYPPNTYFAAGNKGTVSLLWTRLIFGRKSRISASHFSRLWTTGVFGDAGPSSPALRVGNG